MVNKIIAESSEMKSIMDIIDRVVKSNVNIIITGESGTGKELIAREIHRKSNRSNKPFVVISCASMTEELFDSAMFGHIKGSFTNATSDKSGFVEQANEGILYLDEITELSLSMQAKLLRFAQNGEYTRVGSSKVEKSNVRIISSTNQKIEIEMRNGNIREDLFYRLNTIVIKVPPLRKRKEDIVSLVKSFLGDFKITEEALSYLSSYNWPGNIRELQNCIERAKIMSRSNTIELDVLPIEIKEAISLNKLSEPGLPEPLENIEKNHILNTLNFFNGNKSKTSNALGITLKTLYNKLNKYGENINQN